MNTNEIIDIPIYRLSPEAFRAETIKYREEYASPDQEFVVDTGIWNEMTEGDKSEWQERWRKSFDLSPLGRCWKYNEIVGFISIRAGIRHISAEYWFIDSKRIGRRTVRKIYRHVDKAFKIPLLSNQSNDEILNDIFRATDSLTSKRLFKGRYIDTRCLSNLGRYIDWRSITNMD